MAVACRLRAAEGEMHLSADGRRVDIEDARVHLVHRVKGAVDILRVDGRRQSVAYIVGDLDRFFQRGRRNDGRDRPEDLFLSNTHGGHNICKDGRLDEIAVLVRAASQATPARGEPRPVFALTRLYIAHDLMYSVGINDWTHLCLRVCAVSDS